MGANWSSLTKPAIGEDILFNATSVQNCTIDEDTASIRSFNMAAGYTGTVSLGANTLNVNNVADGSNLTITQGTFNAGTGTIIVSGSWNSSAAGSTFTRGTSTVDLTGTGNLATRDTATHAFYSLSVGAAGKTTTLMTLVGVYDLCTVGAGIVIEFYLYLRGTTTNPPLVNGGMLSSGVVYMTNGQLIASTIYGSTVYSNPPAGGTQTLDGDIVAGGNLYVYPSSTGIATLSTAGYSITAANIQVGHATVSTQVGILATGASTISVSGQIHVYNRGSQLQGETAVFSGNANTTGMVYEHYGDFIHPYRPHQRSRVDIEMNPWLNPVARWS